MTNIILVITNTLQTISLLRKGKNLIGIFILIKLCLLWMNLTYELINFDIFSTGESIDRLGNGWFSNIVFVPSQVLPYILVYIPFGLVSCVSGSRWHW